MKKLLNLSQHAGPKLRCYAFWATAVAAFAVGDAEAETDANRAQVTGAFVQFREENCHAGQDYWNAQMKEMRRLGMDTAIAQYVAYDQYYYYPTEITGMEPVGGDIVMQLLNAARAENMKVLLGLQLDGGFWEHQFDKEKRLQVNIATMNELHQRYGSHAGFGGWYFAEEIDDATPSQPYADDLLTYLGDLADRAKELADYPVMISPYFSRDVDLLAYARWWDREGLPKSKVDIVAMQDGVGTHRIAMNDLAVVFSSLAPVMQKHGVQFWSNVEAFDQTDGWPVNDKEFASRPSTWKRFRQQLKITAPLTSKTILFEFTQNLDPNMSPRAKALHAEFLKHSEQTRD